MFLHFHKLTTELFNSIKTQQINVFNASVDSNANCLCHTLRAIKSCGLQSTILLNRGLCVPGQRFLWHRQPLKLLGRRTKKKKRKDTVRVSLQLSVWRANKCLIVCWIWTGHYNSWGTTCTAGSENRVGKGHLLTSVAVTVMLCHMSVSRSSGLASVIFPSSTLMLNCLSRSVWRSMKYLQSHGKCEPKTLSGGTFTGPVVLWLTKPSPSGETCRFMHITAIGNQ